MDKSTLKSIEVRKELTDEWDKRGVRQNVILTDENNQSVGGLSVKQYKHHKDLKKKILEII